MTNTLPLRTLAFLVQKDQVLLGYKKRGFGKGKYVGIGGKLNPGELVDDAMAREVVEEIGVTPIKYVKSGQLDFHFPHKPDWSQTAIVFCIDTWHGEIIETEELKPAWFAEEKIPFQNMWDDAKYWLPQIINKKKIHGKFIFDTEEKVKEYTIQSL